MENTVLDKINEIFNRVEIYPPYLAEPIRITDYSWNRNMEDFKVVYFLQGTQYVFHYNKQLASGIEGDFSRNPLEQLENEVLYIKWMYERGIGSKEYYPFTKLNNL